MLRASNNSIHISHVAIEDNRMNKFDNNKLINIERSQKTLAFVYDLRRCPNGTSMVNAE